MANRYSPEEEKVQELLSIAQAEGAHQAKIISPSIIAVENRAQMRCLIPRCTSYNRSLTCPPNTPKPDEVRKLISEYRVALMVQVKGTEEQDGDTEEMRKDYNWVYPAVYRLHWLLHHLEIRSVELGYMFVLALGGGDCRWCEILSEQKMDPCEMHANAGGCTGARTGVCKQHYKARPALEAMSINVLKTAQNAGLPFYFSGQEERYVIWNGIVLID